MNAIRNFGIVALILSMLSGLFLAQQGMSFNTDYTNGLTYHYVSAQDPTGLGITSTLPYDCVWYFGVINGVPLYFAGNGFVC